MLMRTPCEFPGWICPAPPPPSEKLAHRRMKGALNHPRLSVASLQASECMAGMAREVLIRHLDHEILMVPT